MKRNLIIVAIVILVGALTFWIKSHYFGEPMTDKTTKTMTNKEAGEAFLAKNKSQPGIQVTPSGLQYKILAEGTGKTPKATDTVTVNYRGTTIDGTEFDSSYKRNEPISFPVNGVIQGWIQALQMMKEGAKWQLFIPANLAYGNYSPSPLIPAGSMLIFEVELLKVN